MRIIYLNGPVQNGDFTLADRPGKAVGIRAAEALNTVLGNQPAPHLWNTATLAGDLRHRAHDSVEPVSRTELEARTITAKYEPGATPAGGVLTDTHPAVTALALEMIDRHLAAGTLKIEPITVRMCARCDHMTGTAPHTCRACGHAATRAHTAPHLIAVRKPGAPVLERDDFHAYRSRPPAHLLQIAGHIPDQLLLSRTRSHGISLAAVGLPQLVLDPRAAIHVTVIAAALRHGADVAAMTATQHATAHVAAHGRYFREHNGTRVRYAIHGIVPYDAAPARLHEAHQVSPAVRDLFSNWFLPLCSLRERSGVQPSQLSNRLKFFRRAILARPHRPAGGPLQELQRAISAGDMRWVTGIKELPHLIPEISK